MLGIGQSFLIRVHLVTGSMEVDDTTTTSCNFIYGEVDMSSAHIFVDFSL